MVGWREKLMAYYWLKREKLMKERLMRKIILVCLWLSWLTL